MSEQLSNRAPMIQIMDVVKRFGSNTAVDHVSFDVAPGEAIALWGSNGAGKTTLIRCMLGVTRFDGSVEIDGVSSSKAGKQVRSRIGYVPQMMPMFDLPVGEMVLLITRLRGVEPREGLELLERFSLSHTKRQPVRSLSGGMRQKLALTLALLGSPPVLMFDEPTANLDVKTQNELIRLLNAMKQEGRTLVFTSHRWSEVRALADSVVHLEQGKVVERGSVADLAIVTDRVSLRLQLAPDDVESAITLLQSHSFTTMRNGDNVLVSVQDRLKAKPLRMLGEHGIVVRNFDLEVEDE